MQTSNVDWKPLLEAVGGRAALARKLAVSESTVYRWSTERVDVPGPVRIAVNAIAKEHGLDPLFEAEVADASPHR